MFVALTRLALDHPRRAVGVACATLPLLLWFGVTVFDALRTGGFDDDNAESARVQQLLQSELSAGRADLIVLVSGKGEDAVDDVETYASVLAIVALLEHDRDVVAVQGYGSTGRPDFVTADHRRSVELVTLRGAEREQVQAALRLMPQLRAIDPALSLQFGGFVPANLALNRTVAHDLRRAELIAFPLTAALLAWIFGNLLAALIPVLLGAFSIVGAFAVLHAVSAFTDVSVFSSNMVTVLGLGLSVDYALFLVSRIREEEPVHGLDDAIAIAMRTTGRSIAYSGLTVILSLTGLFLFPQMYLRSMGMGGIAVTVLSVLLALTVLPALVKMVGPRVLHTTLWRKKQAPRAVSLVHAIDDDNDVWARLAFVVMRRPLVVATVVTALLVLCAAPFLRFSPSSPDVRMLSADVEARQVSDILEREFLKHRSTPHEVIASSDASLLTPQGITALHAVVQQIKAIPGVVAVTSVFDIIPGVSRDTYVKALARPIAERDRALLGVDRLLAQHSARIAVISAHELDSAEAQLQVLQLRALSSPTLRVQVGGEAARLFDLKHDITRRTPFMLALVSLVMFVVLFFVFGSVVLPIKAIIMNVLSLSASYGAIVWVFQDGRLEGVLRFQSLHTTDAMQPILMFAGVFGLSMDYEVLLLSRMREEFVRTNDNDLAVARGLTRTGGLITSAALLLVVVIGSFATSSILIIKELGVGMALAIALDATIVRALLVPATMKLLGRWNWWAPAFMRKLWVRSGFHRH